MSKKLIYLMFVVLVLALAGTNVAIGDVWEGRVIDNTDDTEELDPSGTPEAGSSDLEFPYEDAGMGDKQLVAIRWQDVGVPKGATIVDAWLEFTVDEIEEDLHVSVIIEGELNPNPPTFTESIPSEIADRQPRTTAQAIYEPEHWTTVGAKHRTSNIAVVIQEIVNQDGWVAGNALVLIIRDNPANPSKGNRTAEADSGGTDIATLLHIEYTLGKAAGPSPADGAIDVSRDVVLSWTPGVSAAPINGHKVYLSESFDDVSNGIGAITQSANSYTPPQRLDFGTTYYWRVDEVNNVNPSSPWIGNVWSFTTELLAYPVENITATASSTGQEGMGPENTINGSGLDANDLHSTEAANMWLSSNEPLGAWIEYELDKVHKMHEMRVWNSNQMVEYLVGFGLKDVTIEYSTNGTDYTTLGTTHEFARAPGADGYEHNTTVDFGGAAAKYVRLTANSNWGGMLKQYGLSEVRLFTIPVFAEEPSPDSGATDVLVDVVLGFRAGRGADTHDVYLSSDEQAVIDGNAPVTTVTETSYGPLSLDFGTTYYWKINEVNEAETTTTWQGDIWNFTTTDHLIVDDFEDYNDYPPDEIWSTWIDGYGIPTNGATVGYPNPDWNQGEHYAETTIVHGGEQAMPFFYDNTGAATYSEGERTFVVPQDWTKAGVKTLALYFHGAAGNTGQLYVKVNGSKVLYDGDAGNLARTGWQAWNIELASFGTNLQSVTTLAIGIDGNGASGTLYFDNIRLYSYSRQFITPAEPDNAGLVGHWKFDEGAGAIAFDSSGLGNDGTLGPEGDPQWVAGVKNGALDLDGIGDYVSIDGVADDITSNVFTLTAWFKTTQTGEGSLFGTNTGSDHALQFGVKGGNVWVDDGLETQFPPAVNDDQWYFVAYIRDGSTAYIYVDGALRGTDAAIGNPAGDARWSIGQEWDPPNPSDEYEGMVDDVRFYNYVLSLDEIAWLAGRTEPFDKPF